MAITSAIAIGSISHDPGEYFTGVWRLLHDGHGNPVISTPRNAVGLIWILAAAARGLRADFPWLSREG